MANNLTGLNLATRSGEGGADVMSFGQLDRAANLMYQEQKKAELTAAKSFQDADTLLQKELGGIRSADEDEIFNLYKEVADARKELHFNPNVQKDVKVFAEKQKNAALKEATLRQRIAKSKETKKNLESTSKFDLNDFDPDKIKDYPSYLNMPTSELEKIGANVPQFFMNQGVDLSKLAQWKKNAMGVVQKVKFGEEVESADKYNLEQKIIGRMNDPVQFFNILSSNFASKEAAYTARTLAKQMTPQQKTYIQTRFNEIPEEDFKAKWGVSKQDLLNKRGASDDYANEYLILESMQHAVDNLPKEVEIKRRKNDKFVEQNKNTEWDRRNEKASAQADRRNEVRAANSVNNQYRPDIHVNSIYDSGVDDNMTYNYKGQKINGREVALPEELEDKYYDKFKGELQRPNKVIMTKDKKKVYLFYYSPKKTASGNHIIDPSRTRAVDVQAAMIPTLSKSFGGTAFTKTTLFTQEGNNKPQQGNGQKSGRKYKGLDKNGNPIFE